MGAGVEIRDGGWGETWRECDLAMRTKGVRAALVKSGVGGKDGKKKLKMVQA